MARASPTSRIIGATTSPSWRCPAGRSTARLSAVAQATMPSCQVERNPLPENVPPSSVATPWVNSSFRCSSSARVRVIIRCHSRRSSSVTACSCAILLSASRTSTRKRVARRSRCATPLLRGTTSTASSPATISSLARVDRLSSKMVTSASENSWRLPPSQRSGGNSAAASSHRRAARRR